MGSIAAPRLPILSVHSTLTRCLTTATSCSATMSRAIKNLSDLEHAVMASVWKRGRAAAETVRTDLAPKRELKESTVRTLLARLETKGFLRHDVEGRTYVYSSLEAPKNLAARAVRQIIDKFCAGSVEQLVAGLVENRVIAAGELRRLAAEIEKQSKRK